MSYMNTIKKKVIAEDDGVDQDIAVVVGGDGVIHGEVPADHSITMGIPDIMEPSTHIPALHLHVSIHATIDMTKPAA